MLVDLCVVKWKTPKFFLAIRAFSLKPIHGSIRIFDSVSPPFSRSRGHDTLISTREYRYDNSFFFVLTLCI